MKKTFQLTLITPSRVQQSTEKAMMLQDFLKMKNSTEYLLTNALFTFSVDSGNHVLWLTGDFGVLKWGVMNCMCQDVN